MADVGSSEFTSAFDSPTFEKDGSFEVNKPVGSMSISPCGRDVVLASRQGLHIIDLDSPWAPPRHLPHRTPWEVADVQWSPFPSRDYWVISTSNQKALVWNLAMSTPQASIEHVLHAHTRAITDINFSAHHPDVLATCAVDSYVHCWDLRHPERPVVTFCDWFAGATQVKWNRQDPHIIASSHNKILRIWDDRKGAYPLRSIAAHDTKIYGVDWNRTDSHGLVTCSLDKTIKFWDFTNPEDEPKSVLKTPFPVWRARHTPFGCGVLAMPQRGDYDLHLYNRRLMEDVTPGEDAVPVHRFQGHQDQVKEFLWRPRGTIEAGIDNREFQLVSWGADRFLRLHCVDQTTLKEVGYEKGKKAEQGLNLTRKNALYKTFREDTSKASGIKWNVSIEGAQNDTESNGRFGGLKPRLDGMSAGPPPVVGSLGDGDFLTSRPGMRTRTSTRADIDPIAWMKGVKIGKRDGALEQSATSLVSPNFRADGNWGDFESLGEEITHVGATFGNVDFYEINVQNRFVKLSLYGPWGVNGASTYLDCRLVFPNDYPTEGIPSFTIERTATINTTIASKLNADVQTISTAYLAHQRGSLEAVTRYLQGEQTLDETIAWTKSGREDTISLFPEDDGSSSSDEEDGLGTFLNAQADELGLTTEVLSSSNANANVPLPKACGAVWAEDGRLVCFFPPKEEIPQSLLGSLGLPGAAVVSKSGRNIFDRFGNFHLRKVNVRSKLSSVETYDSEDIDSESDSDTSYSSSSHSSTPSRKLSSVRQRMQPNPIFRSDTLHLSGVVDESQRSVGSLSLSRSGINNPKTILSIHNLESLLPSKRILAENYLLSGPYACKHNATTAREYGLSDIAEVWSLIDMITRDEVPLNLHADTEKDLAFLLPATSALLTELRPHSAIDPLLDEEILGVASGARGSIKWGKHPMGSTYLIKALFAYFEQLADVQMLAMMSCIFGLPKVISDTEYQHDKGSTFRQHVLGSAHRAFEHRPTSVAHGWQQWYYPSHKVALSLLHPTQASLATAKIAKLSIDPPSVTSSFGASGSDPVTPFSTGKTPPLNSMPARTNSNRFDLAHQVFSTSPEQLRNPHRSNSNLASSFAASFQRPFHLTGSASSSPPNSQLRKRDSPGGSYAGAPQQGVSWAAASIFGRSWSATEEPVSANTTFDSPEIGHRLGKKDKSMKINLKNQDLFDDEGYSSAPLLDQTHELQYQGYKDMYADMLFLWNLPMTRIDVLQCNSMISVRKDSTETASLHKDIASISIGKKTRLTTADVDSELGLLLKRTCLECNSTTPLSGSISRSKCQSCLTKAWSLCCALCDELIRGRAIPCLACGHLFHAACFSLMVASSDDSRATERMCISGCDCHCMKDIIVPVSWPQEQAVLVSSSPSTIREGEEGRSNAWEKNSGAWEDVAYESLAKNLGVAGAKYVKPKSSQIWTGRDKRANSVNR
ncbi:hypothetical protein MMC11_000464 [Xylographa trunciseda]|nr:hypothetical protein [Xylographa trunciseda]